MDRSFAVLERLFRLVETVLERRFGAGAAFVEQPVRVARTELASPISSDLEGPGGTGTAHLASSVLANANLRGPNGTAGTDGASPISAKTDYLGAPDLEESETNRAVHILPSSKDAILPSYEVAKVCGQER